MPEFKHCGLNTELSPLIFVENNLSGLGAFKSNKETISLFSFV